MKKHLLLAITLLCCMQWSYAQNYTSKITTEVQYSDVQDGWSFVDSRWHYLGVETELKPIIYTLVGKIDTVSQVKKRSIESHSTATGKYTTTAENWAWTNEGWKYEGAKTTSYPPSFDVDMKIVTTQNKNTTETHTIKIEYEIDRNQNYKWDEANKRWLDSEGKAVKGLAKYNSKGSSTTTRYSQFGEE